MNNQLQDHQNKCRCCLQMLTSRSIEISKSIVKRFEELTKIKLILNNVYSNIICIGCNSRLSEFADFQTELIENQLKLFAFVGESLNGEEFEVVKQEEEAVEEAPDHDETFKKSDEEFQVEALDESMFEGIDEHKVPESWQCSECNSIFKSKILLRNHLKREHKETTLKKSRKMCQLCGLTFANNGWYHHQLRAHTADPRFICDFCNKGFRVKHDLKDHIQTHIDRESRRKHPCAFCPAILLSKTAVKNHEHIFHSDIVEEHPCECGKIFSSRMKLYQHRSTVHTKGHYPCESCEKVYTVKNALQKHVTKHHGIKTPCQVCGKKFAPGMFMNRHMKSHGPPQFTCDHQGCEKKFHSRSALGYHVESQHKPQVTVECPTCNAPYNSVRNLNRHIQRQHSGIRVQCEVAGCSHTAARKDYLAAHYRSHKDIDEETRTLLLEKVKEIKVIPW